MSGINAIPTNPIVSGFLKTHFLDISMHSKNEPGTKPSSFQLVDQTLEEEGSLKLSDDFISNVVRVIIVAIVTAGVKAMDALTENGWNALKLRRESADNISEMGFDYQEQTALFTSLQKLKEWEFFHVKSIVDILKSSADTHPWPYLESHVLANNSLYGYKMVANKEGIFLKYQDKDEMLLLLSPEQYFAFCVTRKKQDSSRNLSGAHLQNSEITNLDLSKFTLRQTHFEETTLHNITMCSANFSKVLGEVNGETKFTKATLTEVDMQNADASDAIFTDSTLTNVNMRDTHLENTHFINSTLTNMDLLGAKFNANTNFLGTTITLALPIWDEKTLKEYFAPKLPSDKSRNILDTINSIPDETIKVSLMTQVVRSFTSQSTAQPTNTATPESATSLFEVEGLVSFDELIKVDESQPEPAQSIEPAKSREPINSFNIVPKEINPSDVLLNSTSGLVSFAALFGSVDDEDIGELVQMDEPSTGTSLDADVSFSLLSEASKEARETMQTFFRKNPTYLQTTEIGVFSLYLIRDGTP